MDTDPESSQPNISAADETPSPSGPAQRDYCRLHRVTLPTRYPVQPRPELTIRRPAVVAMRDGEVLLCCGEHDGPHLWPDGDEAGEWPDAFEQRIGSRDSGPEN